MLEQNLLHKVKLLGLVIFLLVLALIALSFTNHTAQQKDNQPNSQVSQFTSNTAGILPRLNTPIIQTAKVQNGSVFIPEIGIKFPDVHVSDIVYIVGSFPQSDDPNDTGLVVRFSTQTIANKDPNCSPFNSPMISYVRTSKYPQYRENLPQTKKIGKYYYSIITPQALCSNNPEVNKLIGNAATALRNAFQKIELSDVK